MRVFNSRAIAARLSGGSLANSGIRVEHAQAVRRQSDRDGLADAQVEVAHGVDREIR